MKEKVAEDIRSEVGSAFQMHGERSAGGNDVSSEMKAVILTEEVGDVCAEVQKLAFAVNPSKVALYDELIQVAATAAMWAGSLLCSCGEVVIERADPQYLGTSRHSKDGCTSSGPCTCGKVTNLASFGAGCDAIRIAGVLHCSFAPCTTEGFPEMPEHG